jgi:hypothetical protein
VVRRKRWAATLTALVRENAQTYRLGWTEVCRDSTKIGVGLPEYILLFRKPPTSRESAQADDPVVHSKDHYTRVRVDLPECGSASHQTTRPR